ncbi:uncharacterized protein LOC125018456 isoform X2 [Mugil cephalus]|uniref:uncharacterized protein LOC125018456 isoform X2 n=1 Tax=Mugil cephalus TaxID=48193 RepID=UPI001FB5A949|nr:uncharacterized protein LOC125018456 isoform X2 [Mugil cephalus]
MRTFNKDMGEGPYVFLYPDCSEVGHVPGTERPFKLTEYKKENGKAYCRITFFLCLETHFKGVDDTPDSDSSDSEIVITSSSIAQFNRADTVVFEPQNQSTPKRKPEDKGDAPGNSSTVQPGQIVISEHEDLEPHEANPHRTTCYSKYTDLYAPCIDEEDEELVADNMKSVQHTPM